MERALLPTAPGAAALPTKSRDSDVPGSGQCLPGLGALGQVLHGPNDLHDSDALGSRYVPARARDPGAGEDFLLD